MQCETLISIVGSQQAEMHNLPASMAARIEWQIGEGEREIA